MLAEVIPDLHPFWIEVPEVHKVNRAVDPIEQPPRGRGVPPRDVHRHPSVGNRHVDERSQVLDEKHGRRRRSCKRRPVEEGLSINPETTRNDHPKAGMPR